MHGTGFAVVNILSTIVECSEIQLGYLEKFVFLLTELEILVFSGSDRSWEGHAK